MTDSPDTDQSIVTPDQENLNQRKMNLEIEELSCKVQSLKRPEYKRSTFWISVSATLIALLGVLGQGLLSSIKSERAELSVEKALIKKTEAEVKAKDALKAKLNAESQKSIAIAESRLANEKMLAAEKKVKKLELEIKKLEERKNKTEVLLNKVVVQIPKLRILAGDSKNPFDTKLLIDEIHSIVTKAQCELLAYQIVLIKRTKNKKNDLLTLRLNTDPLGQSIFFIPIDSFQTYDDLPDVTTEELSSRYTLYTTPAEFTVPNGKYIIKTVMGGKVVESIPVDLRQLDSKPFPQN